MAEAETSDQPNITSPQSPQLPSQVQSPHEDLETIDHDTPVSPDEAVPQQPAPTPSATVVEDDDVQFIFSTPRRKKKKRRAFESPHTGLDVNHGCSTSSCAVGSPRSASASKAERFQTGSMANRDGINYFPAMQSNVDVSRSIRHSSLSTSNTPSFTSSHRWMPSWRSEPSPLLSSYDAQHNWVPIPNKNMYAMKRKWEELQDGPRPFPLVQPWASLSSNTDDLDTFERIVSTSKAAEDLSSTQPSSPNWTLNSAVVPWQGYGRNARGVSEIPRSTAFSLPAISSRKQTVVGEFWPNPTSAISSSMEQPSTQPSIPDNTPNQESSQVPVSQVPDESVSPRTKTVHIFPSSSLVPASQCSLPSSTPQDVTQLPTGSHKTLTEPLVTHSLIPKESRQGSISNPIMFRPSPTLPSDLRRKPSLYKIPPWTPAVQEGSVVTKSPRSTSPSNGQSMSPKHSPNLIVDIAETCQQHFPFAEVAARHKQPPQKIFDTFSAIVQIPLLRHASDNRRNGSLGKKRIKEFKDARRAMDKAQEEERRKMKNASQCQPTFMEAGKPHKRMKKGQGLLKAAILNNARERDANGLNVG